MTRFTKAFMFVALLVGCSAGEVFGQQIVTDPKLNQALITFQQNFPKFVAEHPGMTAGASQPINLSGGGKKVSFTFQQQGAYSVTYGPLQFTSVTPVSADTFNMSLTIQNVTLTGGSTVTLKDKKGKSYTLNCQNNSFTVGPITYASTVTASATGGVSVKNSKVDFNPQSVKTSVPCLEGKKRGEATDFENVGADADIEWTESDQRELVAGITGAVTDWVQAGGPSGGTLKAANSAMQSAAASSSSDVAKGTTTTTTTNGTTAATAATSPCGGTVNADVNAVIADLAAISAQAQAQGFQAAVQKLVADLRTILPGLSAPEQALIQQFINDLTQFTSSSSQGGSSITAIEQAVLVNDFYNVVLSTGVTSSQLQTLQTDLVAALNSLSGISTAQLQADFQKLINDARACLKP